MSKSDYALVPRSEEKLARNYVTKLLERNPGLGEKSRLIADSLIEAGLKPTEGYMLIQAVYSPKDLAGKGQGTRLMHFHEALQRRYGETVLYNASQSPEAFRALLSQVTEAVDMRDTFNESLEGATISFTDALRFQELGLTEHNIGHLCDTLVSENGLSPLAAFMRVKSAIKQIESGNYATLEGVLFNDDYSHMTIQDMEDDPHSEYRLDN